MHRVAFLLLAGHFLFAFCAVDLLHAEDCPNVDGMPTQGEDGCAACQFKRGAHAEQFEFLNPLTSFLFLEQEIALPVESVESREPACCLFLRAPPA
jgi:hypothetical protein